MSPFADRPDHFVSWLRQQGSPFNQDSFTPRRVFGDYLDAIFRQAVFDAQGSKLPITIQRVKADISQIWEQDGVFTLKAATEAGPDAITADSVICADGHMSSGLLSAFEGNRRFFTNPYDVEKVRNVVLSSPGAVGIIGTSQTMMDTLAVLDHIHYKGDIYAFSRNLILPWPFDPKQGRQKKDPYQPRMVTPQNINANANGTVSIETLERLLNEEIRLGAGQEYNIAQVVVAVGESLRSMTNVNIEQRAVDWLNTRIGAVYGNPTPPERYDMLNRFLSSGQMKTVRLRAREENISQVSDGFNIQGIDTENGQPILFSVLFNAAGIARKIQGIDGQIVSPVLRGLQNKGLLKMSADFTGAVQPGEQNVPGLYVAGPATSTGKWGVETFRTNNGRVARESVDYVLGLRD